MRLRKTVLVLAQRANELVRRFTPDSSLAQNYVILAEAGIQRFY